MSKDILTITKPDDWHLHLRDGAMLQAALPFTAHRFGRAIIMPNLNPPITTPDQAEAYRQEILAACPENSGFQPLMTAYLTDDIPPDSLAEGFARGSFTAAKLYPANATTNSAFGVSNIAKIEHVLSTMTEIGMPLLVHGEVTDPAIDIFDREAVFIERILKPLMDRLPDLRVVLEHITTCQSVEFIRQAQKNIAATVTLHHMILNRSDLFKGGIRPHLYCLPIAKREIHRQAVREAATSGDSRFFLGTDSAPHSRDAKESSCGCAGIFNAPAALEIYASIFDADERIANLEAFASKNGPAFYRLPVNKETVTLRREKTEIPEEIATSDGQVIRPFQAGEVINWRITSQGE